MISSLTHELFKIMLFNLQISVHFSNFLLQLISNGIVVRECTLYSFNPVTFIETRLWPGI